MATFYILAVALAIVFPIAALDRNVKWGLLFKYIAETTVMFVVLAGFVLFTNQEKATIGTGDGGSVVFWFLILGAIVAAGEIVGYLRYRRCMRSLKMDGTKTHQADEPQVPPEPNSIESIVLILARIAFFLKTAFWFWLGLFFSLLMIDQFVFRIPNDYVEELHCSLVIVALISAGIWRYFRTKISQDGA